MNIRALLIHTALSLLVAASAGDLAAQAAKDRKIDATQTEPILANIQTQGHVDRNNDLGLLVVFSDPQGAEVFVDDSRIESTPFWTEISPGTRKFRITKAGWLEEEFNLQIQRDKKSVVTALLRKPPRTLLSLEDLAKTRMEELLFETIEKDEYEVVLMRPEWPQKYKRSSALVTGVSTMMALATVEPTQFVPSDKKLVGQIALTGVTLGLMGIVIFHLADEMNWTWEKRPLQENIEFNKRKEVEIRDHNKTARHYNQVILPQLMKQIESKRKEIEAFNKGRGTQFEIY